MKLPIAFEEQMHSLLADDYNRFRQAIDAEPVVSIRLNRQKNVGFPVDGLKPVPWCPSAYYVDRRPSFTFDPWFHAGVYYVQEASSMFLAQVVHTWVDKPVLALDMCAAPGGKSTLLCDALPLGSRLVSNEYVRSRAQILQENLTKWGYPQVMVTHNAAEDFAALPACFDFILVDAPCSGEGMFRKDEVAIAEWSPANVVLCVQRQREILAQMWQVLLPGGILVYSTCTFNTHENEENVLWLCQELGAEVLEVPVEDSWGITGSLLPACTNPVYRFLPHKVQGEGLFMAVLRKPDEDEMPQGVKKKKKKDNVKEKPVPSICASWLDASTEYSFSWHNEVCVAQHRSWNLIGTELKQTLRVLQPGIPLCQLKGKDWIPEPALALSQALQTGAFPRAELTYLQSIQYLRKESIVLSSDTPRGWVLVTYRGAVLGWVKNLGNRTNNAYPAEWRIRSTYLPDPLILWTESITNL